MKNQTRILEHGPILFMLVISVIIFAHSALNHAVAADTTRILQSESELSLGGSALITGHLTEKDPFRNDVIGINFSISLPQSNSEGSFTKRFKRVPILFEVFQRCSTELRYSIIPSTKDYVLSLDEFVIEKNCESELGLEFDGDDGEFFWELNVNGELVSRRSIDDPLKGVRDRRRIPINVETTHKQGKFDYSFLPDNKLEVKAHFRNVTENTNFVRPFSFTQNSLSHDFEKSNLPIQLSDKELGGDGVLRSGEATSVVTFEVIHQNKPFAFFVDANAVVKELLILEVDKVGSGTVISEPPGIDCGTDCDESYREGTSVTLRATPDEGSSFDRWEGCTSISDTTDCVLEIANDLTVTAHFIGPQSLKVTAEGSGAGTVISEPPGIDCGPTCEKGYAINTDVTLTAQPSEISFFEGWTGCDNVQNDVCAVRMDNDKTITARFRSCEVESFESVTIQNQEDVDKIYGCSFIGSLTIQGIDESQERISLRPLRFLNKINGDLRIENNSQFNLLGESDIHFKELLSVDNKLIIASNVDIGSIAGLGGAFPELNNIGSSLEIVNNIGTEKIDGFKSLGPIFEIKIENNNDLKTIDGFDKYAQNEVSATSFIVSNNIEFDCSDSVLFSTSGIWNDPIVTLSEGNKINCLITPPNATIDSPRNGDKYVGSQSITFTGSGTDDEDGQLPDSNLIWTSDIDNFLGCGTNFVKSAKKLSLGSHTITLTATDSSNATGTAAVKITIEKEIKVLQ